VSNEPNEPNTGVVDFPNPGIPVTFAAAREAALEAGESEPHAFGFCSDCRNESETLTAHARRIIAWAEEIQRQIEADGDVDARSFPGSPARSKTAESTSTTTCRAASSATGFPAGCFDSSRRKPRPRPAGEFRARLHEGPGFFVQRRSIQCPGKALVSTPPQS